MHCTNELRRNHHLETKYVCICGSKGFYSDSCVLSAAEIDWSLAWRYAHTGYMLFQVCQCWLQWQSCFASYLFIIMSIHFCFYRSLLPGVTECSLYQQSLLPMCFLSFTQKWRICEENCVWKEESTMPCIFYRMMIFQASKMKYVMRLVAWYKVIFVFMHAC